MRSPLSTNSVDKGLLIQGAGLIWIGLLFGILFFLLGIKDKNIPIGLMGIFFLFTAISSGKGEVEILSLYNKVQSYRRYSQLTFFTGVVCSMTVPFEQTRIIALFFAFPAVITGIAWPIVTVNTYKKHYTSLFGQIDV